MTSKQATMERLERILAEFKEAIVVCDLQAWILLFNPQAKQLFRNALALNLRHSLYGLCHPAPLAQALQAVQRQTATFVSRFGAELREVKFVCSTIKDARLLNCHLRLIPAEQSQAPVAVLFFSDIAQQIDEAAWRGGVLAKMIEELRGPLANLNAAAENLKANPEMPAVERLAFDQVIAAESAILIRRFEAVVQESRVLTYSQWPLADIYSADLLRCVAREVNKEGAITVTMTGVPLWLHADAHALMLTLEALIRAVQQACHVSALDIEALPGDGKVYLDIVWHGQPVLQAIVDAWFRIPLPDTTAGMTVADVLERHSSDMWCQRHRRLGHACLRIPAPAARRQWEEPTSILAARPAAAACLPADEAAGAGALLDVPLASLAFVALNTVATGLALPEEDDILALAGVRIVKGRILSDESFHSLVNPQRPIPQNTVNGHGISDEAVRGKPPIKVVLSQFKAFAADAVLVAHNAALDWRGIRRMEDRAKVRFDNPLLDTLLLSMVADEGASDHSLAGICQRLGVRMQGGQSAMGACLVTAQIFLALHALLEAKGIFTLGQALAASARVWAARSQPGPGQAAAGQGPGVI